jgi:hypothetical protein
MPVGQPAGDPVRLRQPFNERAFLESAGVAKTVKTFTIVLHG